MFAQIRKRQQKAEEKRLITNRKNYFDEQFL